MKSNGLLLGAGPSCIAFAKEYQGETILLEKESTVGGLCRSITVDGGVFDLGGHSFHTPHNEVFEMVQEALDGKLFLQKRNATIFSHGKIIPYPFQKFFDQLDDPAVIRECQEGLDNRQKDLPAPQNFEEFIIQKFGSGIAKHFMLPYNRKLWARDIKRVSCEWTGQRVAEPKGAQNEEKFKTTGGGEDRRPLQPDSTVGYPSEGGFEQIFVKMAEKLDHVYCNKDVVEIDPELKTARCSDGSSYDYNFLVNSSPLPDFLRTIRGIPQRLLDLADQLEFMSLRVELILVGKQLKSPIQRIYSADPSIPPHKIAMNHHSSDYLRSINRHAIMAEVSLSDEKEVNVDEIAPKTIDFLVKARVIEKHEDVIWTGHEDIKYGYPVYTHSRPGILAEIKSWLEPRSIYTIGRFGEWEYINSDKCIMKGISLAHEIQRRTAGANSIDGSNASAYE